MSTNATPIGSEIAECLADGENKPRTAAWIRISRAELPPRRLSALLDRNGGDPERLLSAGRMIWREEGLTDAQTKRLAESAAAGISAEISVMRRLGARIVTRYDSLGSDCVYPIRLRELPDGPPLLFVRGRLEADDQFSIAIVGSRRATSYGLSIAERFAREISRHSLCIVSGGARGVDTCAHRGALAAGGRTIAFIGSGIDVTYPAENRRLFDEMVSSGRGAVVSEYPIGASPDPWRFPARNRLISGMSLGTLVVESPVDSGAMISAQFAAEQGRDVFAVPGPIESGRSSGCHRLIQEGAKLAQCPDDILSELGMLRLTTPGEEPRQGSNIPLLAPAADLDPNQRKVLDLLTLEGRQIDHLSETTGLTTANVVAVLTMLELRGLARRIPGNAFVRVL